MVESLTPKQVAQAIGVSEASLKRWCDQGLLPTQRTAGGHRRLPLEGVIEFLRTTKRTIVKPEILGLPSLTGQGEGLISRSVESLQRALEAGDEELFRRHVFNLYLSGKSLCEICDRAIAPAFHGIGARWAHGEVEIYQERRACEICKAVLLELRKMLAPLPASVPVAIGGTLGDDQYIIPTTMAELVLREAGWNARNLGTALPSESICAALRSTAPRVLWLSVSNIANADAFINQYELVYQTALELRVAVALGGGALTPEIRTRISYATFCDTFAHLVSFAVSLAASTEPRPSPSALPSENFLGVKS